MTPKGFFSIVQFCPDLDRGECANVGIVLVVPETKFLDVRFAHDNEAPKQRFGKDAFDDARLAVAKHALEGRLRHEGKGWAGPDDLVKFSRKEGNNLLLTAPRVILVENAQAELEELFQRLAHVDAKHRRRTPKPDLGTLFEPKVLGIPMLRDIEVNIPELGTMDIPYAYKNGQLNLIRPEGFPVDEQAATTKANDLAVKGHLIHRYPDPKTGQAQQLIVIGGFDSDTTGAMKRKIAFLMEEHDARLVPEDQIDAFVEQVRREAHS